MIHAQNRVECDLYPIIASLIKECSIGTVNSLRDVSTRRSTTFSNVFKGAAGFPDFVIRSKTMNNSAALLGAVEIKYFTNDLDKHLVQLSGHVETYQKVIYTNGLEWRYYVDDADTWQWRIVLGKYDKKQRQIQWNSKKNWWMLLDALDTIIWKQS